MKGMDLNIGYNLCLLLAIEGLMAMMESPHFRTTFASLKKFQKRINFSQISAKGHKLQNRAWKNLLLLPVVASYNRQLLLKISSIGASVKLDLVHLVIQNQVFLMDTIDKPKCQESVEQNNQLGGGWRGGGWGMLAQIRPRSNEHFLDLRGVKTLVGMVWALIK